MHSKDRKNAPSGWRHFLPVLLRVRLAMWVIDTGNALGEWLAPEIKED